MRHIQDESESYRLIPKKSADPEIIDNSSSVNLGSLVEIKESSKMTIMMSMMLMVVFLKLRMAITVSL